MVTFEEAAAFRLLTPDPLVGVAVSAALVGVRVYGVVRRLPPTPDRPFRRLVAAALLVPFVPVVAVRPTRGRGGGRGPAGRRDASSAVERRVGDRGRTARFDLRR